MFLTQVGVITPGPSILETRRVILGRSAPICHKTRLQTFYIYDVVAAATRFYINSSGNVGIGVTNPASALEVNGLIRAHGDISATADSGGQAYQAAGRSSDSFTWAPIAYTNNGSAITGGMAYSPSGVSLSVGSGLTNVFLAYSNGDMYFPICGCWMSSFSDERMKTGMKDLPRGNGLDAIMKLRPVTFHWKDKSRNAKEGEQVGFVAQEVEKVFPDAVREGDMKTFIETDKGKEDIDHPKNLFAASLTAPIVKAI